jgi:hypothetical protein
MAKMFRIKKRNVLFMLLALCVCAFAFPSVLRRPATAIMQMIMGKKTISDRVTEFSDAVRTRLAPDFNAIGVSYPPAKIILVGLKQEKFLEVWVSADGTNFRLLKIYPVLGQSGRLGPKLKEGDKQVPEGLYKIESLNPNSLYHLALRVNYPSDYDKLKAQMEGRQNLGSDIMIHGKSCSIGCLAMGDPAVEDLFILAAQTGIENISVILSPVDFRFRTLPADMPEPLPWSDELYSMIKGELAKLKTK